MSNTKGIRDQQDLWPKVPEKGSGKKVEWGNWPASENDPFAYKLNPDVLLADKIFDLVYQNAWSKGLDLCKKGCCKQVRVRFIWVAKNGKITHNPTNKQTQYEGKNTIQDYVINCRSQTPRPVER